MAAPMREKHSQNNTIKLCEEVVFGAIQGNEDRPWNVGVWDVHTGNLLHTFKNGSAAPCSLCFVGGECLLAASCSKPVINVWNILRQSQKYRKLIIGSKIQCLATSPDNKFIAAGIEDKIHLWQVCTGDLLSVLTHSSVEIKCLKFSPQGLHLLSGHRDGTISVWELQEVTFTDPMRMMDHSPIHTFMGHAGEVTDMHISFTNKVVSSSMDYTVRVWNLLSGEELMMFELGAPIHSTILDHSEFTLFAGDHSGNVYCIDLQAEMRSSEKSVHIDAREASEGYVCHSVHTAPVRCLALTRNQSRVVSASDDKTIKIWSMVSSSSPLVITVNERVSNLIVVPIPSGLLSPEMKPNVFIANLKRHLQGTEEEEMADGISFSITSNERIPKLFGARPLCDESFAVSQNNPPSNVPEPENVSTLKAKADRLKKINEEMYQFAIKEIIK